MSERAHHGGGFRFGFGSSSDESGEPQQEAGRRPPHPQAMGTSTAAGYIVQVPKDQIFRVPPPENAHRYKHYTRKAERKKKSRRFCFCLSCRCISLTLIFLFVLLVLAAITGGALYLVYRPRLPSFDVESLTFSRGRGNLSTLLVLAQNPNSKLGLAYKGGGTVRAVFYAMEVGSADWPEFGLGAGEARGVSAVLEGGSAGVVGRMEAEGERVGSVVGAVEIRVPARVDVDDVQVPLTVTGTCYVKVTPDDGKVLNSTCHVKLELL